MKKVNLGGERDTYFIDNIDIALCIQQDLHYVRFTLRRNMNGAWIVLKR